MPSPKSGDPGTVVPPASPTAATDAATATAGQVETVSAQQSQTQAGSYKAVDVNPYKPPQTAEEKAKKPSWIEIQLLDSENNPVPGEPYSITLPDGQTVAQGTLDEKGLARIDGIEPGTCQITFPLRDAEAWIKA